MELVLVDLFSGIGGFSKGFENAGWKFDAHYFSEIDKYAIANYKFNFKDAENIGSVESVSGHRLREKHPNAKFIITFGWPCQSNSISGKRKGQQHPDKLLSGIGKDLSYEQYKEIRDSLVRNLEEQGDKTRSGLLYEATRIIGELQPYTFVAENVPGLYSVNEGIDFIEGLRVLSIFHKCCPQYNTTMQLYDTSWFLPQNRKRLYFIGLSRNGSRREILPFGEANKGSFEGVSKTPSVRTITAGGNSGGYHSGMTLIKTVNEVKQLNPSTESRDKQPYQHNRVYDPKGLSPALTQDCSRVKVIVRSVSSPERLNKKQNGRRFKEDGEDMFTLTAQDRHGVAIIDTRQKNLDIRKGNPPYRVYTENAPTITSSMHKDMLKVGISQSKEFNLENCKIRRLTERECEALQGFVPDWTKYGDFDGIIKEMSSTQRYKQTGNAVSIPITEFIATMLRKIILNH